ncbi:MAG: SDR family oxidoreductase [Chloroflexota bacterium]
MANIMVGKRVLITGATDGIGRYAARELAMLGAEVIVVGRSKQKAEETVREIDAYSQKYAASYLLADLSSMAEVRQLAADFKSKFSRLDVLVNNAGSAFLMRTLSVDGFEKTFALNHLAYFLLTELLLDVLKASAPSRVVNVSSGSHKRGEINFEDLDLKKGYFVMKAYSQSKLANVMHAYQLARRLSGSGVTANVLHPGLVKTGIFRKVPVVGPIADLVVRNRDRAVSVAEGAETIIYLASSSEVENVTGNYFVKSRAVKSSPESYRLNAQERLWRASADRVGFVKTETKVIFKRMLGFLEQFQAGELSFSQMVEGMEFLYKEISDEISTDFSDGWNKYWGGLEVIFALSTMETTINPSDEEVDGLRKIILKELDK